MISLGPAWIELGVNTEAKSSTAASKDLEKGLFISLFPSTGSEGQIGCASNSICLPCQLEGSKHRGQKHMETALLEASS